MSFDSKITAMLAQQWSNNACCGYVVMAMENCGFSEKDITQVVSKLHELFDSETLEDVKTHYSNSPY